MTSLSIYFVFVLDIVFGAPFVTVPYNKVNSHDGSQFVMFRIPTSRRIINTPNMAYRMVQKSDMKNVALCTRLDRLD